MLRSLAYQPSHLDKLYGGKAWLGHIPFAHWLVGELKPRVFVELGTHAGGSYFAFCDSVADNRLSTKCHAIDSWVGDSQAGFYGEEIFQSVKQINSERYKDFSELHRCRFEDAVKSFDDCSIDLLHIDGLHTYDAVSQDFYTWLPKMTEDAVILFHDTRVFAADFGVNDFWSELVKKYPNSSFEFLHSHGLGVLCLKNEANVFEKFGPAEVLENDFRNVFEIHGTALNIKYNPPKKTVTPSEVLSLVEQLVGVSGEYRKRIYDLVA